jgi:uncharacterized protein YdeI (YjbR/CyaY-like superfamily)
MTSTDTSRLKRALQPMPDFIKSALEDQGLMEMYGSRPAYQRNDYLSWVSRAKLEDTRRKRLAQMLGELKQGDVYMGMNWSKPR